MAQLHSLTGNGHIQSLALQLRLQNGGVDGGLALLQLGLDGGADGVCQLTHDGPLLGTELAHLLQDGGKLTLLAQKPDPQLLQGGRGGGLLQSLEGTQPDFFQLLFHGILSFKIIDK